MSTSPFDTLEQQASYGIGLQVGQQLQESGLEGLAVDALAKGIQDALENNAPVIPVEQIHQALKSMYERAEAHRMEQQKKQAESGEQFLAENSQKSGITTTETGLQFEVLTQGNGAIPARQNTVRVHYTGSLIDGTVFDSSVQRGQPAEFPVNGVIAGWTEALTLMPVGSKWKLYIPHHLAYGERGAGNSIPPYSTLIFEVELLDIL